MSMLSDSSHLQDAKKTLQDLIPLLNWDDDYVTILSADQCMQKTAMKRKKQLDELHAKLKAATKTLEAARSSSTRPASVPSPEQHVAAINELQTQRISLAKAISDAEGSLATKEAELSQLKEEAKDLRESDPAKEHGEQLNGDVVRLRLYKELGFEPCLDEHGNLDRMIIRSESKQVHVYQWDGSKPHTEQCRELWRLASQ